MAVKRMLGKDWGSFEVMWTAEDRVFVHQADVEAFYGSAQEQQYLQFAGEEDIYSGPPKRKPRCI